MVVPLQNSFVFCSGRRLLYSTHLKRSCVFYSNMPHSKRYFTNRMEDYGGGDVKIDVEEWKKSTLNVVEIVVRSQRKSSDDCDGGLYVGLGGIGYMFYHLAEVAAFQNEKAELLSKANEYLRLQLRYCESSAVRDDPTLKAGLLLGHAGIFAVAATLFNAQDQKQQCEVYLQKYIQAANHCKPVNFLPCGGDELFVGRAGYLCGALWLQKKLGYQPVPINDLHAICDSIVESGRAYAKKHKSPCPLMYAYYKTEYIGAAHGLCTILEMLLGFPEYLGSQSAVERDVKNTVDFLLTLQQPNGNFPCTMKEIRRFQIEELEELIHWCHGAPGVVYLMAKAYLFWKEDRYLQACLKCGEVVWQKGLLKKGSGICHGVSGSGYVFLLLYRLTSDMRHLHRAVKFARFKDWVDIPEARIPDSPYSLYEGLAGKACFFADLMQPNKAAFPFLDVF